MKRILILCFLFIASNTIFAQETATKKKTTTAKTELSAAEKEAKQKAANEKRKATIAATKEAVLF